MVPRTSRSWFSFWRMKIKSYSSVYKHPFYRKKRKSSVFANYFVSEDQTLLGYMEHLKAVNWEGFRGLWLFGLIYKSKHGFAEFVGACEQMFHCNGFGWIVGTYYIIKFKKLKDWFKALLLPPFIGRKKGLVESWTHITRFCIYL